MRAGTLLTDVLSAIRRYKSLYPLITGKTSYPNSASPLMWVTPSMVPFYLIAFSPALFWGSRQPPAFPCRLQHSIIGRFSLNRRVRDGYGCFPEAHRHRKSFVINFFFDNSTVKHFTYFFFPRKEVIQPHLPIRLPCYDFTPVIRPAFGSSLLAVGSLTSGVTDSHGVTGGVYKTRERIHRDILIRDY